MKLICTQNNFKKAINSCEKIVVKKNTLPILNNILFETENNYLKLYATNLEIGISSKIGAKVEKQGKIAIPAKIIGNFSNNLLEGENITLELSGNNLRIKSDYNLTTIKGVSPADFPLIPVKKTEYLLNFSSFEFKTALTKVLPAVAINEARQELTGINLLLEEKEIFFAATDSFRLAEFRLKLTEKNTNLENYQLFMEKNKSLIVPANTLIELNRIMSYEAENESEGEIKIAIEEGQIFFETGRVKLVSRLINGKYPEYKHIMPKKYETKIIGKKQLLQNAIKMASVFSAGGTNEISLKIDPDKNKIFILSSGAETGENLTELKFEVQGPSQEVVFNAKYLLDGINTISSEKVAILINNKSTPVAVQEVEEKTNQILDDFIYIVMPVKN